MDLEKIKERMMLHIDILKRYGAEILNIKSKNFNGYNYFTISKQPDGVGKYFSFYVDSDAYVVYTRTNYTAPISIFDVVEIEKELENVSKIVNVIGILEKKINENN